jgi:hypothetical protein
MSTSRVLDERLRELHETRFKEFEEEVLRHKALSDRASKFEPGREKRRREFLKRIGVDLKNLDSEREKDQYAQEKELEAFLDEFRAKAVSRRSRQAADAKDAALRSAALAEGGHLVLPPFASSIYAADKAALKDISGVTGDGAINSGWVFPDEPGKIRIKDSGHVAAWCYQAVAGAAHPVFSVHFAFVPATTATYEMTAVLAFHGFYVLRSDDSWYNCRYAEVKLNVQMNVNQYVDMGVHSFPALIDRHEDNVEEVTNYDHTGFFDYTTVLKAGDPVVVTVSGNLRAFARGGGAYAELNFEAGTANYIEPLLLSVNQV